MKLDFNISQFTKGFSRFLHRYHVMIFTLLVIGGLSVATLFLYNTINSAGVVDPVNESVGFDKETIKKINELRGENEQSTPLQKPNGRTNPFQ